MTSARGKLREAEKRHGALLSVGLEPAPEYLPEGFPPTIAGYRQFLTAIVTATRDIAAAYKFNLAFFESLGPDGWQLLHDIRAILPDNALIVADAKRGDIGSTAKHYARAVYEHLGVDSVTLNPLMGRDSAEPFLAYRDKLSFFLVLTSNRGADDFLLQDGLYRRIASTITKWGSSEHVGFVVGATRPDYLAEIRSLAPQTVFLVPGVGAQGGDAAAVMRNGGISDSESGLLIHATRSLLPEAGETGDPVEIIHRRSIETLNLLKEARHS
jgi:orotidine-5'-phosphate decarboxylase